MKDIRVAKRYAGALFAVAQRNGILDAVAADLTLMHRRMTDVPYLRAILMEPLVSDTRKTLSPTKRSATASPPHR